MNKYHQLAIELKYEGNTYKQIAERLGGKFTEGTLQQLFAMKGKLCKPYLEYQTAQNKRRSAKVARFLTKEVERTTQLFIFYRNRAHETGDYRLATKLTEKILKLAGEQINK